MNITAMEEDSKWLLLVFTLPTSKASERVQMWRKLQRFGAIPFRNAGSLLPNTPGNQERFEWLATAMRENQGEASILQIHAIDDLSYDALKDQFRKVRAEDYRALIEDLQKLMPSAKGPSSQVLRLRQRFEEIVAIDFFTSPLRGRAEEALAQAEQTGTKPSLRERGSASKGKYQKRTWITVRDLELIGRPPRGLSLVSSMRNRSSSSMPVPPLTRMPFRLTCSRVSASHTKATAAPSKRYVSRSIYLTSGFSSLRKRFTTRTWKTGNLGGTKDTQ